MDRWSPALYRKKAREQGVDPTIVENALSSIGELQIPNLPIILTLGHLSFHTDMEYVAMQRLVARAKYYYRDFRIRKRSGGFRPISVPSEQLLHVQKWIDHNILKTIPRNPNSFAFSSGSKIRDCAEAHLRCKWLIKIDLRDFFGSISEIQVFRVFKKLGYNPLLSFQLARICTKTNRAGSDRYMKPRWLAVGDRTYGLYRYPRVGHLGQGSPTSPRLSNLVTYGLDDEIVAMLGNRDIVYTRYADDMILSTTSNLFSFDEANELVLDVFRLLPKYGLRPNNQKVQVLHPGARKVVLGLLVDSNKVRLPKQFRSNLECHLYFIKKDAVGHAQRRGFKSLLGLKNYVSGLLAHAKHIDLEYFEGLRRQELIPEWPI